MKKYLLLVLMLITYTAFAQVNRPIVGKVISAKDSLPLAGATILLSETNRSFTTNSDGVLRFPELQAVSI